MDARLSWDSCPCPFIASGQGSPWEPMVSRERFQWRARGFQLSRLVTTRAKRVPFGPPPILFSVCLAAGHPQTQPKPKDRNSQTEIIALSLPNNGMVFALSAGDGFCSLITISRNTVNRGMFEEIWQPAFGMWTAYTTSCQFLRPNRAGRTRCPFACSHYPSFCLSKGPHNPLILFGLFPPPLFYWNHINTQPPRSPRTFREWSPSLKDNCVLENTSSANILRASSSSLTNFWVPSLITSN